MSGYNPRRTDNEINAQRRQTRTREETEDDFELIIRNISNKWTVPENERVLIFDDYEEEKDEIKREAPRHCRTSAEHSMTPYQNENQTDYPQRYQTGYRQQINVQQQQQYDSQIEQLVQIGQLSQIQQEAEETKREETDRMEDDYELYRHQLWELNKTPYELQDLKTPPTPTGEQCTLHPMRERANIELLAKADPTRLTQIKAPKRRKLNDRTVGWMETNHQQYQKEAEKEQLVEFLKRSTRHQESKIRYLQGQVALLKEKVKFSHL